jgi:hypothetical protein
VSEVNRNFLTLCLLLILEASMQALTTYTLLYRIDNIDHRVDSIPQVSPNGCARQYDGVDYFYVCKR